MWTSTEDNFLKENYGKITRTKIALALTKSDGSVKQRARKFHLTSNIHFKLYTRNNNAFSNLTLESCYWAGFIAADGCINIKHPSLHICLSPKDLDQLDRFRIFVGYSGPLHHAKNGTNLSLTVSSKFIIDDLAKNFNIFPRKSLTLEPPKNLTHEQSLAYIIGYIDGDGTLNYNNCKSRTGKRSSYLRLRIIGTPMILNWINKILKTNAKPRQHCKSKISIISIYGENLLIGLKGFITDNTLPVLARKWDKIKFSTLPIISKTKQAIEVTTRSNGQIRRFDTIKEASQALKIDRCYISHLIWEPIKHKLYIFKPV